MAYLMAENRLKKRFGIMNDNPIKSGAKPANGGRLHVFFARLKKLDGNPHYIAMGMAIGVFVSITPTIPFHTVLAIALAFIFKGSKAAAAIGVWFSNPVTIPFFYYGSYKTGVFILGKSTVPFDTKYESIKELLAMGIEVTVAMLAGGLIIGVIPGLAAYFITLKAIKALKSHKKPARIGGVKQKTSGKA